VEFMAFGDSAPYSFIHQLMNPDDAAVISDESIATYAAVAGEVPAVRVGVNLDVFDYAEHGISCGMLSWHLGLLTGPLREGYG
jgi:hypothetical protein